MRHGLVDAPCGHEAGHERVAAAAEFGRERGDVDRTGGAQRHPQPLPRRFLQHAGHLGLGAAAEMVDEALGLVEGDAVAVEVVDGEPGAHEPMVDVELGPSQRHRHHLHVLEPVLLEQLTGDVGDGQVVLGQLLGEVEHVGGGVGVLEAAGVGDQPDVEAQCGVAGERPAQLAGEPAHDDRGGGHVGEHHVVCAEALVVGVMVEDHDLAGPVDRAGQFAEPVDRAEVEGDQDVGVAGNAAGGVQLAKPGQELVVRADHERLGPRRHRGQTVLGAEQVQGQHRPEGVAVGMVVADEGQ